jgi:outer membrane protein TolC
MKKIILVLCVLFLGKNSFALSLHDTIKLAFEKNDLSAANALRLKAEEWDVKGTKLERLPNGYISYSQGLSYYTSVYGGDRHSSTVSSGGLSVGASVSLYDGGVNKNRICVAEKNYEAQVAVNNSTNALIPDTLGSLAKDVFDNYIQLSKATMKIDFYREQGKIYEILLKYTENDEQKNEIIADIRDNDQSIDSTLYESSQAIKFYEHQLVMMPLSSLIDSLEVVATQIEVPKTADEAVQIGLIKNPEITIANAHLEAATCALKAQKAQGSSWKVDAYASTGTSNYIGGSEPLNIDGSVGVTISKPLSPSSSAYMKASALRLEANEKDLDKEVDRFRYSIEDELYPALEHQEKEVAYYLETLQINETEIKKIIVKLEHHEPVDYQSALKLVGRRYGLHFDFTNSLNNYVNTKFNIQRKIGTLFDKIHSNKNGLN